MQNVEEQRFEKFGVLTHPLEVETLELGKGNRVFRVVEEETELTSLRPLREAVGDTMSERVGEDSEEVQGRVKAGKDSQSVGRGLAPRWGPVRLALRLEGEPLQTKPGNPDSPLWAEARKG